MNLSRKIAKLLVKDNVPLSSVVEMLTKYKMLSLLPLIQRSVEEISKGEGKRERVQIESPFPLSEDAIAKIKMLTGGEKADHDVTINKSLLAGFKARYKEILYDGSAERIVKNFITK